MKIQGRVPPSPGEYFAPGATIGLAISGIPLRLMDETIGTVTRTWVEGGDLLFEADIDPKYKRLVETQSHLNIRVITEEER